MTTPADPLAAAYLEHMQLDHVPHNTIRTRMRTLSLVGNPSTASREDIEAWWLSRGHMKPATRANDLANLRTFYRWAALWEHRLDDPTIRLKAPKVGKSVPRPIPSMGLRTLLDDLEGDMRRTVCLGAYAGLRVSEAARLDWRDIDVYTRRARVLGKGSKLRVVDLSEVLLVELLPNTGGNVVTAGAKPYTATWLDKKVNRAIRTAGVDATFHQLRHYYGVEGYQGSDGDLLGLGEQMGHESVETTAGYSRAAAMAGRRIADAVAASTPR